MDKTMANIQSGDEEIENDMLHALHWASWLFKGHRNGELMMAQNDN